ncbi:MAG: DUF6671 family protein [Cyanobacteriota bacterium]|nr:DUF6671 family protein [Cyanobacteriota bacterium]
MAKPLSAYAGRRLCLTTRHGKQRALARPFAAGLGLQLEVCPCDTDALGTFSGEIARQSDALQTCRRKALLGLEATGLVLGLASEASFGPHPAVPMLAVGQELLVFIDRERQLELVEQRLELRTNYSQITLESGDDPAPWLAQVGFPSHAVIARPANQNAAGVGAELLFKGLRSTQELHAALQRCQGADPQGKVMLETDMRAHLNPTRMGSIRRLGFALVRRLCCPCPACGSPGWGLVETVPGLPCSWCGQATNLTASEIWGCPSCGERRPRPRRDGLQAADPGQCDWCNP